jgi:hypothetical protein
MNEVSANNNLLSFPEERIIRKNIRGLEEVEKTAKENHINQIVDYYAEYLVRKFSLHGVDIESNEFDKHFALSIEFLRASIYKSFGLDHTLHDVMSDLINEIEEAIDNGLDN